MEIKQKKRFSVRKIIIFIILGILAIAIIADTIMVNYHSNPASVQEYETDNRYITKTGTTYVSAHRSGGGIAPEESMMAFKNCIESEHFNVDVFEFDLHITKDNVLVLLHDDTLGRTTDCEEVLGNKDAAPEDYTYEELRQLNIGAKFENDDGEMPYANLKGDDVPDDLRIVRVDDILDYLMANGDYDYIIEIKNDGDLGCKGVDILYQVLEERNLLDNVVFGTFHEEVSYYVDDNYPALKRSATIKEVLDFYKAALTDDDNFEAKYISLQIPYNMPWRIVANLGTTKIINYAHKNNIDVQYWTINSEKQLEYLTSIGADCIMTDYPDKLYDIVHNTNE